MISRKLAELSIELSFHTSQLAVSTVHVDVVFVWLQI